MCLKVGGEGWWAGVGGWVIGGLEEGGGWREKSLSAEMVHTPLNDSVFIPGCTFLSSLSESRMGHWVQSFVNLKSKKSHMMSREIKTKIATVDQRSLK